MMAAVPIYTAYNDSHWNAHKYQIDSHFDWTLETGVKQVV